MDFDYRYKKLWKKEDSNVYHINSFSEVLICDPFYNEKILDELGNKLSSNKKLNLAKPGIDITNIMVYSEKRFEQSKLNGPIKCVYIPSFKLMFKMMRACLGAET